VRWLGHHGNAQQDLANLADVWAPGQDMSNPDSWTAPILTALKCSNALLLTVCECTEWGPASRPASSHAPVFFASPAGTQNPNADGTGHSNPPSALPSLVLPPLSMLFVSSQGEGQHQEAASNKQGDVELVNFGLVGSNDLVIDVSICCNHIVNTEWPRSLKCLNCGNQKIEFSVKNRRRTSKRLERASCSGRQRLLTAGHPP